MSNYGRTTDDRFWKSLYSSPTFTWGGYYGDGSGYGKDHNEYSYSSRKTKRRHEFTPVLLILTTVYNCKHCGIKKEDAKTEYCDEQEDPGEYW